jgi:putative photosynthetic complex assembly protein
MSDTFRQRPFPRGALLGAGALVALSLVLVAVVRISGADISQMPPSSAIAERDVRFEDRTDGGVAVYDARSNELLQVLPPGSNGFVRATMRGLARDRRSRGVGATVPFHLAASADGRLTLEDLATGRRVELEAFGHTNANIFAGFLRAAHGAT